MAFSRTLFDRTRRNKISNKHGTKTPSSILVLEPVNMTNAEEKQGYTWEQEYDRSWEDLKEDESGTLKATRAPGQQQQQRESSHLLTNSIHRGLIRYVYIVLDLSRAMEDNDFRPSRMLVAIDAVKEFVSAFYDENPLSSCGIILSKAGLAERLTPFSSSPSAHLQALRDGGGRLETSGEFSLQNSLSLALGSLKTIPSYGTKECIFVTGAVGTTDPGDIFPVIEQAKAADVRCSVVSLAAEMFVAKLLVEKTGGVYSVAQNKKHFRELLLRCVQPPPKESGDEGANAVFTTMITMGFPSQAAEAAAAAPGRLPLGVRPRRIGAMGNTSQRGVVCTDTRDISFSAFYCPRCRAPCSEVPSTCRVCRLPLIAAPHLARSYHHLFPVPKFEPLERAVLVAELESLADSQVRARKLCNSCRRDVTTVGLANGDAPEPDDQVAAECPRCSTVYCVDCSEYIHDTLHNCPGCLQPELGELVPSATELGGMDVG